jgi:hypothetical protein
MPPLIADDMVHVFLVGLSTAILAVSILAYLRKRNSRYLLLSVAFTFLTLSQTVDLVETLFMSSQLIVLPIIEVHLSHFFEFLMLSSFGLALTRK